MGKWTNNVIVALKNLGGEAKLNDIYNEFEKISKFLGQDFNEFEDYNGQPNWKATVRRELQQNSIGHRSHNPKTHQNLFINIDRGIWKLIESNIVDKSNEMKIESEKSIKSKEIHSKGKEAEVKLTEFFEHLGFDYVQGAKANETKRGINYIIVGGKGQIDVVAKYKNYLFICHCSTDQIYKNLSDKFEQIPSKQANAITYLKNPNQSHLDFKIDDNTKVICVFDVHRVKIDHAARIKKKIENDTTGIYDNVFLWDRPFKEYYRREANLNKKIALNWLLYSVGIKDTSNNKSFECIKINYGIGNNAPDSFLFTANIEDFYKYAVVSHRIPFLSDADYYQRLLNHTRLKSIANNYLNKGGYFPNNIIVNIEKDEQFNFTPHEEGGNYGTIEFNERCCAQVIDGQHRLFSYLEAMDEFKGNVVINALNVSKAKEAEFFVKINEEQVGIDKELLCDLKGVMYPDDLEGKISNAIKYMNSDSSSYFYEKIKMPSFSSKGKQLPISTLFREIKKHYRRFLENKNRSDLKKKNYFYFNQDKENQTEGPKRLATILSDFFNKINERFSTKFKTRFLNNNTKGVDIKRYTHTLMIEVCMYSINYLGVNSLKFSNDSKTNNFFDDLVESIEQSDWEGLSGYAQYTAYIQELVLFMREVKNHKDFAPSVTLGTDDRFINDHVMTMEQKINAILLKTFTNKYDENYFNDDKISQKYYHMPQLQQARTSSIESEQHPQKHADFSSGLFLFMSKKLDLATTFKKKIISIHDGRFLSVKQFETKCRLLWEYGVEVRHKKLEAVQLAKKYNTKQLKIFKDDARDVHYVLDSIINHLEIDMLEIFQPSDEYKKKYFL